MNIENPIRIALVLTPPTYQYFQWAAQIGVTDYVARYPTVNTLEKLTAERDRAGSSGLRLSVVEGYLPLHEIVLGTSGRDAQIEEMISLIRNMGGLDVPVLCYNFMPHWDWTRTSFEEVTRGGALTSGFDAAQLEGQAVAPERRISGEQLWENLAYFLASVVPVAEDAGVRLAMHPDDPPLPSLLGAAQIMYEVESFERLFDIAPSRANGACFCQGTFAEMGVDIPAAIRRLGTRIHYVHCRDVTGEASCFVETFHDNGKTDMAAAMRAYREIGFSGMMRPDHVPKLTGEPGQADGYTMLGRLFAVGYLRGLLDGVGAWPGRGHDGD